MFEVEKGVRTIKKILKWVFVGVVGLIVLSLLLGGKNKQSSEAFKQGLEAGKQAASPAQKEPLPKIEFSGKVEPALTKKGEKVVITFDVTNTDESKTIEGMRILFANEDFLKKGLVIVNVMSGGQQDGRAFQWTNDLMKIAPKGKRSFVIVATANEPGNYESVVTFRSPTLTTTFDDQGQELKAKLTVLPQYLSN